MKFCPKCNKEYGDEFDFCSKCGYRLEDKEKRCRFCGKVVKTDDEFCPYCGKALKKDVHRASDNNVVSKSKDNRYSKFSPKYFFSIVFVALLCVALYFGFGKDYLISKNFQAVDLQNCMIYVPKNFELLKEKRDLEGNQLFSCMIRTYSVNPVDDFCNWYSVDVFCDKDKTYNMISSEREDRDLKSYFNAKWGTKDVISKEICSTKFDKKYLKVKEDMHASQIFGGKYYYTGVYLTNSGTYIIQVCGPKEYVVNRESEIGIIFDMFTF